MLTRGFDQLSSGTAPGFVECMPLGFGRQDGVGENPLLDHVFEIVEGDRVQDYLGGSQQSEARERVDLRFESLLCFGLDDRQVTTSGARPQGVGARAPEARVKELD